MPMLERVVLLLLLWAGLSFSAQAASPSVSNTSTDANAKPLRMALITQAENNLGQGLLWQRVFYETLNPLPEIQVLAPSDQDRLWPEWPQQQIARVDRPAWARKLKADLLYFMQFSPSPAGLGVTLSHYDTRLGKSSAELSLGPLPLAEIPKTVVQTLLQRHQLKPGPIQTQLIQALTAAPEAVWQARAAALANPDPALALTQLTSALEVEPQNATQNTTPNAAVYLQRGLLQASQIKDIPAAERDFALALKHLPNWPEALYQLGLAAGVLGKPDQASAHFQQILKIDPRYSAELPWVLGLEANEKGQVERALDYFKRSLAVDPAYAPAYLETGRWWFNRARYPQALAQFSQGLRFVSDPEQHYDLLLLRASALTQLKRHKEALADAETAVKLAPDKPLAWYLRGLTRAMLEQCLAAQRDWQKACELGQSAACTMRCEGL